MVLYQHHLALVAADGEGGNGFAGDFAGELGREDKGALIRNGFIPS